MFCEWTITRETYYFKCSLLANFLSPNFAFHEKNCNIYSSDHKIVDLSRQGMTMEDIIKHFTGALYTRLYFIYVIMKRVGSNPKGSM
jgi:hypothetical protein